MTTKVNFNDFVRKSDFQSNKSEKQIAFEESIRLHLLLLPIDAEQANILRESLPFWLSAAFKSEDGKATFDEFIRRDLSNDSWKSLNEEQKSAIIVKANNALFAAGKFYSDLPINSKHVSNKAKEIFGGLLNSKDI